MKCNDTNRHTALQLDHAAIKVICTKAGGKLCRPTISISVISYLNLYTLRTGHILIICKMSYFARKGMF